MVVSRTHRDPKALEVPFGHVCKAIGPMPALLAVVRHVAHRNFAALVPVERLEHGLIDPTLKLFQVTMQRAVRNQTVHPAPLRAETAFQGLSNQSRGDVGVASGMSAPHLAAGTVELYRSGVSDEDLVRELLAWLSCRWAVSPSSAVEDNLDFTRLKVIISMHVIPRKGIHRLVRS